MRSSPTSSGNAPPGGACRPSAPNGFSTRCGGSNRSPTSASSAGFSVFEGFAVRDFETSDARIHGRIGGSGPPLLLLHGNPLTHVSWHKIAPRLAEKFTVVATDLRGYGDSSKPSGGERSIGY